MKSFGGFRFSGIKIEPFTFAGCQVGEICQICQSFGGAFCDICRDMDYNKTVFVPLLVSSIFCFRHDDAYNNSSLCFSILRFTLPCPLGDRCFPAFHLYNFLLGLLQALHIIWTFLIFRVIYRALNTGKVRKINVQALKIFCSRIFFAIC